MSGVGESEAMTRQQGIEGTWKIVSRQTALFGDANLSERTGEKFTELLVYAYVRILLRSLQKLPSLQHL